MSLGAKVAKKDRFTKAVEHKINWEQKLMTFSLKDSKKKSSEYYIHSLSGCTKTSAIMSETVLDTEVNNSLRLTKAEISMTSNEEKQLHTIKNSDIRDINENDIEYLGQGSNEQRYNPVIDPKVSRSLGNLFLP